MSQNNRAIAQTIINIPVAIYIPNMRPLSMIQIDGILITPITVVGANSQRKNLGSS
jgi:hypothetical protein